MARSRDDETEETEQQRVSHEGTDSSVTGSHGREGFTDSSEELPSVAGNGGEADQSGVARRDYLKLAAGTAATAAGVGMATAGAAATYSNEVDIVEAGADPNGNTPIDSVLDSVLEDDTKIVFPAGEYRLNSFRYSGLHNVALVAPEGARLVPPSSIGTGIWINVSYASDFRFEGFTLDNTASGAAPAHLFNATGGTNLVKDVTVEGFRPNRQHCIRPWAEGSDTSLTLENVRMPDGNHDGAAIYVPEEYLFNTDQGPGSLVFKDCYVENFSQGVYASGQGGPLAFLGGEYANCGICQIRVGGGNTRECVVRGVTVRVDGPAEPISEKPNMRGIWLREGEGTVVEDCDVFMTDVGGSYTEAAILIRGYHGDATIRDTRIRVDENVPAIKVSSPNSFDGGVQGMSHPPSSWDVELDNVSITGAGAGSEAVLIQGRNGSIVRNACINQTGSNRDGIRFSNSSNCTVENASIDVSGQAVNLSSSTAETSDISYGGTCPAPTGDSGSTDLPNTITLDGDGTATSYEFDVTGAVEKSTANGATINTGDSIDGSTVAGITTNQLDSFGFEGEITRFETDSDGLLVTVNGSSVDPGTIGEDDGGSGGDGDGDGGSGDDGSGDGGSGDDGSGDEQRTIYISGEDTTTFYEFTVSDTVEKASFDGATMNDFDGIQGNSVSGVTTSEPDAFAFTGEITQFEANDSDILVRVDGTAVDPAQLGDSDDGSGDDGSGDDGSGDDGSEDDQRVVTISGNGTVTYYELEATGTVEKSTAYGATTNQFDSIEDGTVSGVTTNEPDSFTYTGELTSVDLSSADGTVHIDGEEIDPDTIGEAPLPNRIVIDGSLTPSAAQYEFSVAGELEADSSASDLEDGDAIDGSAVSGSVTEDTDSFRFSGELETFNVNGTASVTFDNGDAS